MADTTQRKGAENDDVNEADGASESSSVERAETREREMEESGEENAG